MEGFIQLGVTALMLVGTYLIGSYLERKHFASIAEREQRYKDRVVITMPTLPKGLQPQQVGLVTGSVVVSLDYFKRFLAGLRAIIGGRIHAYETLMDRARREAILRMREEAEALGYDTVINVRLETSRLASTGSNGRGTAGVEVLAFGTGLQTETRPASAGAEAGLAPGAAVGQG